MTLKNGFWWRLTGSNRRPPACKAGALPAELRPPDISMMELVGLGGLEPPTSRLSSARSNQLSYKPSDRVSVGYPGRDEVSQGRPAVAACAAPSRSASSQRLRYGARAQVKVIREERETKAAGTRSVCATVRVTLFRLVPSEPKGRGFHSHPKMMGSVSIKVHP